MKAKLFLCIAAIIAFMSWSAFAQHGHGGGMASSMHGSSHSSSTHGSSGDHSGQGSSQSSVSTRLSSNTKLASKLQSLLPPGTDLQTAASGFKNLGQFVAAVHVSHNLGIPFDQLKAKMQGPPTESLGKAIHQLKPDANAKAETKTAESEAHQDMDNDSTN
ncbi:MAG TPA: hypothetical protein VKV30_02975 [Candidatus Angelobacter sp.]|nr:hypothetical protein [Candidatus Angelobacter sp.]